MVASASTLAPCPGCGALFPPDPGGAVHPYIGASAGCWALYTPMSAGHVPDPALVARSRVAADAPPPPAAPDDAAALLVDAYAAQHHGVPSPQAVQSVAVHLLALHGVLQRGQPAARAMWVRQRAVRTRGVFAWLAPPPALTAVSIRHLFAGGGVTRPLAPAAYVAAVHAAWQAAHGATIAGWYDRWVLAD